MESLKRMSNEISFKIYSTVKNREKKNKKEKSSKKIMT